MRLLGISADDLVAGFPLPEPSLFADAKAPDCRHRLEAVVGDVRERFGAAGLTRAALLDRGAAVSRSGYVDPRRKS